ncbi:MAG: MGMT family protein [Chloroflexi bacterium]|nr:MGMT family protein [Chloroflexota bacterium]
MVSAVPQNGGNVRRRSRQSRDEDPSWRSLSEGSFPERVYALVRRVPRGRVITYGAIATVLGDPRKAREVGWAMAICPESVPYQRVINARGQISSGGDVNKRRTALEADGVIFLQDGRVDLEHYLWLPGDESGNGASPSKQA